MNEGRGTALAFFLILLVTCAGTYWAIQTVRTGGTLLSFGGAELISPTPAEVLPTFTPFIELAPSPTPLVPQTPVPVTPSPTPQPPIQPFIPTPAPVSPTPTPSPVPTRPTAPPTPIPTPTPSFPFIVLRQGPDFSQGCNGHYIFGYIYDQNGNPLPGVRVHVFDYYGNDVPPATSKVDPPGWYDVLISGQRNLWVVEVVDEAGNQLSPRVEVLNTGNYVEGKEACWHRVDFKRVK